jgi:hypothetical protein
MSGPAHRTVYQAFAFEERVTISVSHEANDTWTWSRGRECLRGRDENDRAAPELTGHTHWLIRTGINDHLQVRLELRSTVGGKCELQPGDERRVHGG